MIMTISYQEVRQLIWFSLKVLLTIFLVQATLSMYLTNKGVDLNREYEGLQEQHRAVEEENRELRQEKSKLTSLSLIKKQAEEFGMISTNLQDFYIYK